MKQDFIPLEALRANKPGPANTAVLKATGREPSSPRYWRSLEELSGAKLPEREPDGEPDFAAKLSEKSRRRFLELMGASLGLAGLTACTRQPTEFIVPYAQPPENAIPGRPMHFATAVPVDGIAQGVIVETHLGRPTKVEGNPAHPSSLGATSVLSQSSVLDLYDPDRARVVTYLGNQRSWDDFINAFHQSAGLLQAGAGLHILTQTVCSPTLGSQLKAVLEALPQAKWHQYHPTGAHSAYSGAQLAFGRPVNTVYRLDRADVILGLDSDFLACGQASTRMAREFAVRRRQGNRLDMNRLYVIESILTSTGGKADHRLPMRWADVEVFARDLAAAIGVKGMAASNNNPHQQWISAVAADLMAHYGASAVIPGDHQSPGLHALAHAINAALGNAGNTVVYTQPLEVQPVDQIASIRDLAGAMDAGQVQLLLILGGNPAYDAPADLDLSNRLKKVRTVFHVSQHFNETSVLCNWHVPETHVFEDWGDARAHDGTVTITQPLIEPFYDAHSHAQVLDVLLQFPPRNSYEILRGYWMGEHTGARGQGPGASGRGAAAGGQRLGASGRGPAAGGQSGAGRG